MNLKVCEKKYKSLSIIWTIAILLVEAITVLISTLFNKENILTTYAVIFTSLVIIFFTLIYLFLALAERIDAPVLSFVIGALMSVPLFSGASLVYSTIPAVVGMIFVISNVGMLLYLEKKERDGIAQRAKERKEEPQKAKA